MSKFNNTELYDKFFKWYKKVSQNMKDNDMDNEQICYLSWMEGRSNGISFAQKSINKLFNDE